MATNAQYLAANLANHYNFKQQQFNNILKYLVSQESITPGASTALIEDIQRQQSALKERRLALSRLRQSGLLADKELIVELEKIKGDLKEVTARGITDVATARAQLQKVFTDELEGEEAQGRSQFGSATNTAQAREAAELQVVGVNAPKSDLVDSVQKYYDDHIKARHEALGKDSVAYAQFNQQLKQHLQNIAEQRARTTNTPAQGVADEVLNRLGINSAETPDQAKQRVSDAFQKEVISPLRPGGAGMDTTARAIALGMSEESLKQIFKGDVYVDSPDARKFARAAYFSRYLPQNLDENLQPRLGGEGLTEAEFLAKLQAGDEEAQRLYNMVLQREPSEVALLSEGQYPYELYQITRAERGLDKKRGELGKALDPARRQRGFEALYQEARSIYNNLFRGGGVRDPGARQANKERLERGGPELQAAVRDVSRTEDELSIVDAPAEVKEAVAAQSEGKLAVENGELVDTATREPRFTLDSVVDTTAGKRAGDAIRATRANQTPAKATAALANAARVSAQPTPMQASAIPSALDRLVSAPAQQGLGGAQTPTSLGKPPGLSTDVAEPLTSRAPMGSQPQPPQSTVSRVPLPLGMFIPEAPATQAGLPGMPEMDVLNTAFPNNVRTQITAYASGLAQADAITGSITDGIFGSNDRITNDDILQARIQAYEQTDPFDLPDGVKRALEDLGKTSKGAFTQENVEQILGPLSNNPSAKTSATTYAKIHGD